MIKGIEQVVAQGSCQVASGQIHARRIQHRQLEGVQVSDIVVDRLWTQARQNGGNFGQPVRWLDKLDRAVVYPGQEGERLVAIRLLLSVRK